MAVGAEAGFIRHDDWATGVLDATAGQGVNLILDCVGGSYWDKNAQLLATEATWVLYGLMGGPKVRTGSSSPLIPQPRQLPSHVSHIRRSSQLKGCCFTQRLLPQHPPPTAKKY